MLGDGRVGKTSIIGQYSGRGFDCDTISTAGLDNALGTYQTKVDARSIKTTIWDTVGQERFHDLTY